MLKKRKHISFEHEKEAHFHQKIRLRSKTKKQGKTWIDRIDKQWNLFLKKCSMHTQIPKNYFTRQLLTLIADKQYNYSSTWKKVKSRT